MLDLRGTGKSAIPADPGSYRCDRLVDDISALQDHLGLDRFDLLGHSAGANIAVQYAVGHQRWVSKLALITPGMRVVDLEPDSEMRREVVRLRQDQPWFTEAAASFDRVTGGEGTEADWRAMSPFFYGRWDAAAQAHDAAGETQTNDEAAQVFGAEGAFNPAATRAALAVFDSPVLILGGGVDLQRPPRVVAEFAPLFSAAHLVVQPDAGQFPWLDDPGQFVSAVTAFLDAAAR